MGDAVGDPGDEEEDCEGGLLLLFCIVENGTGWMFVVMSRGCCTVMAFGWLILAGVALDTPSQPCARQWHAR